jgi:hypothetical protein
VCGRSPVGERRDEVLEAPSIGSVERDERIKLVHRLLHRLVDLTL